MQKGFIHLALPVIVLLIIGFLTAYTFSLKMNERTKKASIQNPTESTEFQNLDLDSISNLGAFSETAPEISYSCEINSENNPDLVEISKNLKQGNSKIYKVCKRANKRDYLVVEGGATSTYDSVANPNVLFYEFNDSNSFTLSYLYPAQPNDEAVKVKIIKWFENNEVIFSFISAYHDNPKAVTYVSRFNDTPKLIEYCNWGIGGGTSVRMFGNCKTVKESNSSIYLKNTDLP